MIRDNNKKRQKRKELPQDVAQGTREQTDYEKFQAENAPVEDPTPTVNRDQAFQEESNVFAKTGKAAAALKDKGGVGGFAANLVAAPFRGAERLSLEFLDLVGVGSDEQIEDARQKLNLARGKIYSDPDVQDLALTVGLAGLGKAIGGIKAGTRAARMSGKAIEKATIPNYATITRSITAMDDVIKPATTKVVKRSFQNVGKRLNPRTGMMEPFKEVGKRTFVKDVPKETLLKKGATITTQRGFIGKETSEKLARQLRKLDQPTKVQILNRGLNWAKNNKLKAGAIGIAAGANATWYWGASDNIATGAVMRANEAVDTVKWYGGDKATAQNTINQAKAQTNLALGFQIASQLNPAVSLTGGWVMIANTLAAKKQIKEQERKLSLM